MAKIKGKLQVVVDTTTGREYCVPVPIKQKADTKPDKQEWQNSHCSNKKRISQKTSP